MDKEIIFYSTHCPRCQVLEVKLKQKNLTYTECNDVDAMAAAGIKSAPGLRVYNDAMEQFEILDFNNAIKWIKAKGN